MKTQTLNKLAFNKASITELNDSSMVNVNGGSSETVALSISLIYVTIKVIEYVEEQQTK